MTEHCTSVRCVDVPVLELEALGGDALVERIAQQALGARDKEGAGAIVLGCGGMADLPARVSERVGLPVVDGVAAAVKLAEVLVELGLVTSKHGDLAFPLAKGFNGRFAHFGG
jgi:allantoin racemase